MVFSVVHKNGWLQISRYRNGCVDISTEECTTENTTTEEWLAADITLEERLCGYRYRGVHNWKYHDRRVVFSQPFFCHGIFSCALLCRDIHTTVPVRYLYRGVHNWKYHDRRMVGCRYHVRGTVVWISLQRSAQLKIPRQKNGWLQISRYRNGCVFSVVHSSVEISTQPFL
jgi:hypothetical protein